MADSSVAAAAYTLIPKTAPAVTAPKANTLTYDGTMQKLAERGSAEGGVMYYAVTEENEAPDPDLYSVSVPMAVNAGTYYVWYQVKGDAMHLDIDPVCVEVTLSGRLVFCDETGAAWQTESAEAGEPLMGFADVTPEAREGYTFAAWSTDAGQTEYASQNGEITAANVVDFDATTIGGELFTMVNELNVHPIWVKDRVKVLLVPGDSAAMGTGTDGKPQSDEFFLEIGEPVYMGGMNAAARPGYALTGWYTQDGTQWTESMTLSPVYCDSVDGNPWIRTDSVRKYRYYTLTLTAGWDTAYTVTVTNGRGSGTYASGDLVTVRACQPDEGMVFTGWTGTEGLTLEDGSAETEFIVFYMPEQNVTVQAVFEMAECPVYTITTDGTAAAIRSDGWLGEEVATDAQAGEVLYLRLTDDAEPAAGYYFTGEFKINGVSLGSVELDGFMTPVTEFTMPVPEDEEAVEISAVQAKRESVTLDFAQSESLIPPYMAVVQLSNGEETMDMFSYCDDETDFIDLDGSGTPDLAMTKPDFETTFDFVLTRLADADAVGQYDYEFTGNTDRFSPVTFIMSEPADDEPDFIPPSNITAIEEAAFEGVDAVYVYIPNGCESIGDYAFRDCLALTRVRIPSSVTEIGTGVFEGCREVYVYGAAGSTAEAYCDGYDNCIFVEEAQE